MKPFRKVSSLAEFIAVVTDSACREALRTEDFWYRGHRQSTWTLAPSMYRPLSPNESPRPNEQYLYHEFRARALQRHRETPAFEDIGSWIALMQHYRLPTRLLDWSRSPLIAAYFAVEDYIYNQNLEPIENAAVWLMSPWNLLKIQGIKDSILTIQSGKVRDILGHAFYGERYTLTQDEKARRLKANIPDDKLILPVYASEIDMRMFVQQGAFTVHQLKEPIESFQWASDVVMKIEIDREYVHSFAAAVSRCGLRKGDVYPDLDSLSFDLAKGPERY